MKTTLIPHILHVEDSEADIEFTRDACDETGCVAKFTIVRDGAAALAHVQQILAGTTAKPDLIILDLNLPKVSGHGVLASLRQQPELANTPIIVLTSTANPLERDQSLRLGATAHLTKPTGFQETQEIIKLIQGYLPH
jgi:CheY-like chemotaxis protein